MAYYCSNPWSTAFIWKNGDVTHCCYSNFGPVGNIKKNTLEEIWKGDKIKSIREHIACGRYIDAGCEHFCRPFRWNRYYGEQGNDLEIPEGLGRISGINTDTEFKTPSIIGIELDGSCNFKCTHCLASNGGEGLSEESINKVRPYMEKARIIRVVGGEFTVNKRSLEMLGEISKFPAQPTVFMNTNGHIGTHEYKHYIENLRSFHLKFSLEGLNEDYEKVRIGGKWERFKSNLLYAKEYFDQKNKQGYDWKLYLNFCVMKSNLLKIPDVVKFAVDNNIPLVLNTINGMRHIDENIFMYDHFNIPYKDIELVVKRSHELIDGADYIFSKELKQHLDYVVRALKSRKIRLPKKVLKLISLRLSGQKADRLLYIYYKWIMDKKAALLYVVRKIKKRFRLLMEKG